MRSAVLPASTLKRKKHWKIICSVGFIRKQNKYTQTNTLRHSYYTQTHTNTQKILWNFEQNDARKTKNIFKTRDKSTTTSKSRVVESYMLISSPTTIHPVFGAELWKLWKENKRAERILGAKVKVLVQILVQSEVLREVGRNFCFWSTAAGRQCVLDSNNQAIHQLFIAYIHNIGRLLF